MGTNVTAYIEARAGDRWEFVAEVAIDRNYDAYALLGCRGSADECAEITWDLGVPSAEVAEWSLTKHAGGYTFGPNPHRSDGLWEQHSGIVSDDEFRRVTALHEAAVSPAGSVLTSVAKLLDPARSMRVVLDAF